MAEQSYEVLVVGGGPAGMSAALYSARYDRRVALFDVGEGRGSWHQTNYNYLGFVGGIKARELGQLAREQLGAYPQITIIEDRIDAVGQDGDAFVARSGAGEWRGRAVILCTGTVDNWPQFEGWREYVGRSMFWCITCDGYESKGKRVLAVGNSDEAASTTLQLQRLTDQITMLTNSPACQINTPYLRRLEQAGVPLLQDEIDRVVGDGGQFEAIVTKGGHRTELDRLFSLQGAAPRNALARQLGVALNEKGYIVVDTEQKTNVAGVYAAGDITCLHSHQVAAAVHEGGQAASAANYFLYPPELKEL
jgi:thioredoxin reductase (NADPH)